MHFFGVLLLGREIAGGHDGAFAGEVRGYNPADVQFAARDEDDFTPELFGPFVAFADELWLGGHFMFEAGLAGARVLETGAGKWRVCRT